MAELAKAGTASPATIASAVTQPNASSRVIGRGASGRHPSSTSLRAAASGITAGLSDALVPGDEVREDAAEAGAQLGSLQGQLDVGPQVVEPVAGVVAAPAEDVPVDGLLV